MWLFREKTLFSIFHKLLVLQMGLSSPHQLNRLSAVRSEEEKGSLNAYSRSQGTNLHFLESILKINSPILGCMRFWPQVGIGFWSCQPPSHSYTKLSKVTYSSGCVHLCSACVLSCSGRVQLFATLCTTARQAPLCPWDSPGKKIGVHCFTLFQGILLTQQSNLHLLPALAGRFFTTSATWEALR